MQLIGLKLKRKKRCRKVIALISVAKLANWNKETSRVVGEEKKVERNVDYSLVLEGNNKCLEIDPEFVFAMFNIANVYAKSGEIQKAIDMYTKVLEVDKDIAEAYFNRGLLYIYQGNRSAANVDLSKAGELGLTDSYSIIKRYCSVEEE